MTAQNIVLIGMPAAGKSTVGRALAERARKTFIDTDDLVAAAAGMPLRELIQTRGTEEFRRLEQDCIESLVVTGAVIATGGSAVYGERAMEHLRRNSLVVFLDAPLEEVRRHIGDQAERAVVRREGQSIDDLYRERRPLYRRWAELTVPCTAATVAQVVEQLAALADCPA